MVSLQFCDIVFQQKLPFAAIELQLMSLDKPGPKIDLKSIIESKTSLMIDSEFWDRFRALITAANPILHCLQETSPAGGAPCVSNDCPVICRLPAWTLTWGI